MRRPQRMSSTCQSTGSPSARRTAHRRACSPWWRAARAATLTPPTCSCARAAATRARSRSRSRMPSTTLISRGRRGKRRDRLGRRPRCTPPQPPPTVTAPNPGYPSPATIRTPRRKATIPRMRGRSRRRGLSSRSPEANNFRKASARSSIQVLYIALAVLRSLPSYMRIYDQCSWKSQPPLAVTCCLLLCKTF